MRVLLRGSDQSVSATTVSRPTLSSSKFSHHGGCRHVAPGQQFPDQTDNPTVLTPETASKTETGPKFPFTLSLSAPAPASFANADATRAFL